MLPSPLRTLAPLAALALLGALLLWPMPLVFSDAVLAARDQEAATHIWGLWAALQARSPLIIDTPLLGWPDGVSVVLVDPANLPAFALGALRSPAAGYNLVLASGLAAMGLAGAALARQTGGRPWLGAVAAMACPTLLANAADGMTEGFAVGWVGLQLALLLRFVETGRRRTGLAAALALAATWYGGPYNGIFASMVNVAVGIGLLIRHRISRPVLSRLLSVAGLAALLCLPLAAAVLSGRGADLPGSEARAGLPSVGDYRAIFRGGVQTGADLLDPWLPGPLTGGEADPSHTAYLGLVALIAAGLAVARDRRRWPWLLGALAMSALSLGPHLYLKGQALSAGGHPLLAPAGLLTLALPFFGRLTRWYRAGAVATLLLAPLVAAAPRSRAGAGALAAAVVLDALLLAPLQWPLHHTPLPDASPYAMLQGEGAIFEIPRATSGPPAEGQWRDGTALAQTLHGHPLGGTVMRLPEPPGNQEIHFRLMQLLKTGRWRAADRARALDRGFRWLALYPAYLSIPEESGRFLARCLGPPLAQTDAVWLFSLDAPPGEAGDCEPSAPRTGSEW